MGWIEEYMNTPEVRKCKPSNSYPLSAKDLIIPLPHTALGAPADVKFASCNMQVGPPSLTEAKSIFKPHSRRSINSSCSQATP